MPDVTGQVCRSIPEGSVTLRVTWAAIAELANMSETVPAVIQPLSVPITSLL
jgi:hypothetical protein